MSEQEELKLFEKIEKGCQNPLKIYYAAKLLLVRIWYLLTRMVNRALFQPVKLSRHTRMRPNILQYSE